LTDSLPPRSEPPQPRKEGLRWGLRFGLLLSLAVAGSGCTLHPKIPPAATEIAMASFSVDTTQGKLAAQEALQSGPLVLLFYRGHW